LSNKISGTKKGSKTTTERVEEQDDDAVERVDKQAIRTDIDPPTKK
jgi:hypothetical protein